MADRTPPTVVVADTSVSSSNSGDQIIVQALRRELGDLLARSQVFTIPTHCSPGFRGRRLLRVADVAIVAGTNLLGAHPSLRQLWRTPPLPASSRKYVLAGVGWGAGPPKLTLTGRRFLRSVLHPEAMHSTRDQLTAEVLRSAGFDATFTGCPTTWSLANAVTPPSAPGRRVVMVLNWASRAPETDEAIIDAVTSAYDHVGFWAQSSMDRNYFRSLPAAIERIPPNVRAFVSAMSKPEPADYVGTRLHAGVASLAAGARTTIFALDDRMKRMGLDSSLPMYALPQSATQALSVITDLHRPQATIPTDSLREWKRRLHELCGLADASSDRNGL